jgi:hypothetical protein
VGFLHGLNHIRIGTVGYIQQADVVVFAIHAPGVGLVDPLKPVGAYQRGMGISLFVVVR